MSTPALQNPSYGRGHRAMEIVAIAFAFGSLAWIALTIFIAAHGVGDWIGIALAALGFAGLRRQLDRRQRTVIVLLDDFGEHEPVSMSSHGANEQRFPRIVAQRAAQRANRLAQCAVGDDNVAPDAVEDVATMDGFVAALNEKYEKVEVARNQPQLATVAEERSAAGRKSELAETKAGQDLTIRDGLVRTQGIRRWSACDVADGSSVAGSRSFVPSPRYASSSAFSNIRTVQELHRDVS